MADVVIAAVVASVMSSFQIHNEICCYSNLRTLQSESGLPEGNFVISADRCSKFLLIGDL